jgi:hypothetical protein
MSVIADEPECSVQLDRADVVDARIDELLAKVR